MTRTNRILAAALLLAGCGSSADADKTAPFVGPWTVTTGTLTGMCTGLPAPFMQPLTGGQQTITKTADGALSLTILPNCNITMDVAGTVATLRATTPPQTCMFQFMFMGTSLPVMATFSSGTFTVTGSNASFSYVGSANAGILNCMVTGTGTSMKGAAPDGSSTVADSAAATVDSGSAADTAPAADGGTAADTAATTVDAGSAADSGVSADASAAGDAGADSSTDGP
jgi:hypothetical protein